MMGNTVGREIAPGARYDVVIAGGGLAGLTLARLLKRRMPNLAVAVVEKQRGPLPEATHKVGESTLAAGGYYLQEVLGLGDYLKERQLLKFGLRYFYPTASRRFEDRPEFGRSRYKSSALGAHGIPEWQVDRGRLENDLRQMNVDAGVDVFEGHHVDDVELSTDEHLVTVCQDGSAARHSVRTRWFVDAMGRRRFLQKRLGLEKKLDLPPCSAAWFRIDDRIDLTTFPTTSAVDWHARARGEHPSDPSFGRYNSTNHLMGDGYWVWLIPLSSGATSVGIVVQEGLIDFEQLRTYDRALKWLEQNEPHVAHAVRDRVPMDFKILRNYTRSSRQVLSEQRWACTGEAGCFQDPFYSPGTDAIGFMNCVIAECIRVDRLGLLTAELAAALSNEFITWSDRYTRTIQSGYAYFGRPLLAAMKTMWDMSIGQSVSHPLFFSGRYREGYVTNRARWLTPEVPALLQRCTSINDVVVDFFREWAAKTTGRLSFEFLELLDDNPLIAESYDETHAVHDNPIPVVASGAGRIESMALALFFVAVDDVLPERLSDLLSKPALDPRSISLSPERWHSDGLFRSVTNTAHAASYYRTIRQRLHLARGGDPAIAVKGETTRPIRLDQSTS